MTVARPSETNTPPDAVWVYQLPDGHWEVRFSKPHPDCKAIEYNRAKVQTL